MKLKRQPTQQEKQFINGFLQNDQAAQWVAQQTGEKLVALINVIEDTLDYETSDALVDMLHTARLDECITIRQIEWWKREILQ